ncbi:MAG TPA: Rid family detoxifying hydrolase [Acidimicrobiia bacterium]|nr:Rid family detoxifying hydrolase [Acidimicrobiia bacterium]
MPKLIHEPPSAPKAAGPYSVATEANGFVFVSGQVGIDPAVGSIVDGGVVPQCHQIMKNLGAILGDLDLQYSDIVKTTIFLGDINDFGAVNEAYNEYVAEAKPARSTFQVAALPLGAAIEIEVIAAR